MIGLFAMMFACFAFGVQAARQRRRRDAAGWAFLLLWLGVLGWAAG